jgi:SHS2 domain-containing protein
VTSRPDPRTPAFACFDVEADPGVAGRGPTLPEAFVQACLGVFAAIVDPDGVEEREVDI